MTDNSDKKVPDCWSCVFFSITWDPRFPYACGLMGFKSKITPCLDVVRLDGNTCLGYIEKKVDTSEIRKIKRKRKVNFLA